MNDAAVRDHINRVKTACRGEQIAVGLGLKRKGKRFFCPSCQPEGGKTPDLQVYEHGFKCFKCGLTGDVIDLAVLAGRMSKAEAIAYLERRTGIERPEAYQDKYRARIVDARRTAGPAVARSPIRWEAAEPMPAERTASHEIHRLRETDPGIERGAVHADLYCAFLKTVCRSIIGTPGAQYLEGRGITAEVAN